MPLAKSSPVSPARAAFTARRDASPDQAGSDEARAELNLRCSDGRGGGRRCHRVRRRATWPRGRIDVAALMRKKVDARVRTLVENGVALRHRTLFVIVGDAAREQVVNLHYMLSKAAGAHAHAAALESM